MRHWLTACIALVSLAGLVAGCCKSADYHYTIRPAVRAMVPYTSYSSFAMRHSSGKTDRFHFLRETTTEAAVEDCSECCDDQEFRQTYSLYFLADSSEMQANIQVSQTGQQGVLAPTNLEIHVNGAFYFADFTDSVCSPQPALTCLDSLVVGGTTYYGVFEFRNQSSGYGGLETRLYYDPGVGIVKFLDADGIGFWELMR